MREYLAKLRKNIEDLRQYNGTFRASWSEEYNYTWLRDNFYNNLSYLNHDFNKYIQTCHTHLDFLKMYENDYDHKLSWLIKDPYIDDNNQSRFIHPKVNFNGTEVEGLRWRFNQEDSLPYMIIMMYKAWQKDNSKPFRNQEDRHMIQLLVKIIEALDIMNIPFGASWEEESSVFLSNLSLSMYALESAYEMGFDVDRDHLRKLRRKVYGMLPYERTGRDWDLTMLFPCLLGVFKPIDVEDIVKGVITNLQGEYGVKRYLGDVYKPFDRSMNCNDNRQPCRGEMQWLMGFGYLSYIFCKDGNREMAKYYANKLIEQYPDAMLPEGVNEKGEACVNSPLCWSMSMLAIAIDAIDNGNFI